MLTVIALALLVAALPGCGGGGGGSNSPEPPNPPPPVTRAFDMGFTTWPYDATVAAVNFVYTETSARGDFIAHHLDGGILRYLETVPEAESLWHGGCFVFDERGTLGHGPRIEGPPPP